MLITDQEMYIIIANGNETYLSKFHYGTQKCIVFTVHEFLVIFHPGTNFHCCTEDHNEIIPGRTHITPEPC